MKPVVVIIRNPSAWNNRIGGRFSPTRELASNTGGNHQSSKDGSIVFCLSSLRGLDYLRNRGQTVITSYEEIFGYIDEENELVAAIPEMTAAYNSVWDPYRQTEEGVVFYSEFVAIPAGYDTSHLTLPVR